MAVRDTVAAEVARERVEVVRVRRHLHRHPEKAFEEVRTAALVAERCAALGLQVRTGVGGTGVLADLDSGRPGPTVLARADMDALPIQEEDDGRSYRSERPGLMHACGHDGHVAVALGAAAVLTRLTWPGRVRFCFQPAEETDDGARRMIEDAALASVDVAVGLHLQAGLATGTVAVGAGVQWAHGDEVAITVRGHGGHAGDQRGTADPIEAAAELIVALRAATREARTRAPVALGIAQFAAGTAANVIPSEARMSGTVRAVDDTDRAWLRATVERIAGEVAERRGVSVQVRFGIHCPAVVCDPEVTRRVAGAVADQLGPTAVVDAVASTACDDMGRFLREVPGCYFRVGASDLSQAVYPHHHPRFDLDERALPVATAALVRAVLAQLESV